MAIKRRTLGRYQVFSPTEVGQGYRLYTYTRGGLNVTDKATYKNLAGTTAHTNPIVFDGRGEADIWWDGEYDIRLDDDLGNLVWTMTDIGAGEDVPNYGNYNVVLDGGFEDDANGDGLPDQWIITTYPNNGAGAGTASIDQATQVEGSNSLRFDSLGDGGGYAESAIFQVSENVSLSLSWLMQSSVADVRNVVDVIYYNSAQVQISTVSVYDDSINNVTAWGKLFRSLITPSGARFARIRLTGAHSSDPTAGTTWFDDVRLYIDPTVLTLRDKGAGVNTTSGSLLVIENNNDAYIQFKGGATSRNGIFFGTPASEIQAGIQQQHDQGKLVFLNGATQHVSLDASGNINMLNGRVIMDADALDERKAAAIITASSIDIGAALGNFIDITGPGTINQLGTAQAGVRRILRFLNGPLTLTHNSVSLILPGSVDILTQDGDAAEFLSLGFGNWVCTNYQPRYSAHSSDFTSSQVFYIENSRGTNGSLFDLTAVSAAWESIGPTGSGAANTWVGLNSVTLGAKWVEVRIHNRADDNTGGTAQGVVYARATGSSAAATQDAIVSQVRSVALGSTFNSGTNTTTARIPVDSLHRFDMYRLQIATSVVVSMYLVGWGV